MGAQNRPPGARRRRRLILAGLVAAGVTTSAVTVAAITSERSTAEDGAPGVLTDARQAGRPLLVFRSLTRGSEGRVGLAVLGGPDSADAELASLECERITFNGVAGICLTRAGTAEDAEARVLGPDLRVRRALPAQGIPNRARVSPDGRWGSVTLFVSGHSYESRGEFSTETTLIDLRRGEKLANLEEFTVSHAGRVVTAEDRNFWGTTFGTDGDTFYATLAYGGDTYLVRGSIRDRTMRTLHANVECPSLSPDGMRIAYKQRIGTADNPWRLAVLDLRTMRVTPLPGTSGLDDQPEWLDDRRILYAAGDTIAVVPADGSGAPRAFRARAASPTVVRWGGSTVGA